MLVAMLKIYKFEVVVFGTVAFALVTILPLISVTQGQVACNDFLMKDVCEAYLRWGKCHLREAKASCRKTCKVCGAGWTAWGPYGPCSKKCLGEQTRTRNCKSAPSDCPGLDHEIRPCNGSGATACASGGGGVVGPGTPGGGVTVDKLLCNDTHFSCGGNPRICVEIDRVCDGYEDCQNGMDEEGDSCIANLKNPNAFQIKNEFKQVCMEVITDDPAGPINGVRAYRRCPSDLNPQRGRFIWRWWRSFHLINIKTARCLEADSVAVSADPKLSSKPCDSAQTNQQWVCDDDNSTKFLLVRIKKYTQPYMKRYISLGDKDSGWPPLLEKNDSSLNKLWQRGPIEPPQSICGKLQVYWSEWADWSPCSKTCTGGTRTHSRTCVNGVVGQNPCVGNTVESGPCNNRISCSVTGSGSPNSVCPNGWYTVNNTQQAKISKSLDPGCFQLIRHPGDNYEGAKKKCEKKSAFLASIKEEGAQKRLENLIKRGQTTTKIYIGIREDFYLPPVQGHHLRYEIDDTPVGHFKPWKTDCVLGPGYDYTGTASTTSSGVLCQKWTIDQPHTPKVLPTEIDYDHSYCRNPDLDPNGPWCYTTNSGIVKDYCEIPQCLETVTTDKLSPMSEFQLAIPCEYDSTVNPSYSIINAVGLKLQRQDCYPNHRPTWQTLNSRSKFAWDTARSRILNLESMQCLEASSIEPDSEVFLKTCDPLKVTQRWSASGKKILLRNGKYFSDLQLDTLADNTLGVTASELSAWSISKASGHIVDWSGVRALAADDSFYMYSVMDDKCLGVNANFDKRAALEIKYRIPLVMLPCKPTPNLQWMKYLSSKLMFFHLQTSLCLSPIDRNTGSVVMLLPCSTVASNFKWKCHDDLLISTVASPRLYLTTWKNSVVLDSKTARTSKWIAWKTRNKTVCDLQTPRGNVAIGSRFAIRNAFNGHCLQTDSSGNVFSRICKGFNDTLDEIWRFAESPTMLMHYATRRCLELRTVTVGSSVTSQSCDLFNNKQHWTLFPSKTNLRNSLNKMPYYSLHLVVNLKLMLTIDGKNRMVVVRDSSGSNFIALNKFGALNSVKTMADCIITNKVLKFYRGNVSTTKTGKTCRTWSTEDKSRHPELKENFCRNPGNNKANPWCYVDGDRGGVAKQECLLGYCPIAKVAMDRDGYWYALNGKELLSFICQADPGCYRGKGQKYAGAWSSTTKGDCVDWSTHNNYTDWTHNFCRNPDGSAQPWCYTNPAVSNKSYCTLRKCHNVCLQIPENLYNSEVVKHDFSATIYGLEEESSLITQCHRGFWVTKEVFRSDSFCRSGQWVVEPVPCKRITCSGINVKIPKTKLTTTSELYSQIALFTCDSGTLSGPGKPSIRYRCNDFGEWEEEENQQKICTPPCDPGWKEFRAYCYKINDTWLNFEDAVGVCKSLGERAYMADIDDKVEFDFLKDLVLNEGKAKHGSKTLYWVGIRHYPAKVRPKDPMWRNYKSINILNEFEAREKKGANYLPFLQTWFYIMHYMHNRRTQEFDEILAYDRRCMFVDAKHKFVASRGCYNYARRKMLWMWVSPFHLYNIASQMCLTGFPMEGFARKDIRSSATVKPCNIDNKLQYVGCLRHGHASLKLLFHENSFFVDNVYEPWDKIQMGGGFYGGNYSIWVLNTTDYDICHHSISMTGNAFLLWKGKKAEGKSYTYSEAQTKCKENGGKLATRQQLAQKMQEDDISSCACAWGDGGTAYSVMRTRDSLCPSSAPSGGVKTCTPIGGKADAWCFKGKTRSLIDIPWAVALWLYNATREGVQERDSAKTAKFICKKESRWHCPEPPDIYKATITETIATSYSYLGSTTYECDTGFWFSPGVFTIQMLCTASLQWDPRPETLKCTVSYCNPAPDIINGNKTLKGRNDFGDTVEYRCHLGYWFTRNVFVHDIRCGPKAKWYPPVEKLTCSPVLCDPPPSIEYAILETYSYEYKQNASYTCKAGYWVAPGHVTQYIYCNKNGLWEPSPYTMKCWEVVCLAPANQVHAEWKHIDKRTTIMSCAKGFQFRPKNCNASFCHFPPQQILLSCKDDGRWVPDAYDFLCVEILCNPPPTIELTHDTKNNLTKLYQHAHVIFYYCYPGYYLHYAFSLYTKTYERCIAEGDDGFLYASKLVCGTYDMIYLKWEEHGGSEDGMMRLIEANGTRCLAPINIPTKAYSERRLVLENCGKEKHNVRFNWFCNKHGVSDLILGIVAITEFYLSIDLETNLLIMTGNKLKGIEFVSYFDRSLDLELDVCRYRQPQFAQPVTCLKRGGWTPNPTQIQCLPIHCKKPPVVPHATFEVNDKTYSYATTAQYICEDGYEYLRMRNSFISRCSEFGTWVPNPKELPCHKKECPPYKLPYGTRVVAGSIRNIQFGDRMRIACQQGYYFRKGLNDVTVTCGANKVWESSHQVSGCQTVLCQPPPTVNLSTLTINTKYYFFNTIARYICYSGFWIEPGIAWRDCYCTQEGSWFPDPKNISCRRVNCSDPGNVYNTYRYEVPRPTKAFGYGSVVMYRCTTGKWFARGLPKVSITCRDDGQWYPHPSTLYCEEMSCLPLEPLPPYAFVVGEDFSFGSTVTIMCEPGYVIGGQNGDDVSNSTELSCTRKQTWNPPFSTVYCTKLSCGNPPSVASAYRIHANNFFESYAQYHCNIGYWFNPGMSTRLSQCNRYAKWEPDPKTFVCRLIDCGHPGRFPNAEAVEAKNGTVYGSTVTVECGDGFWLESLFVKKTILQCLEEGMWEPPVSSIHCVVVRCGKPDDILHSTKQLLPPAVFSEVVSIDPITGGSFYLYGVRMKYSCLPGYEFAPQQRSIATTCSIYGNWSLKLSKLKCEASKCPPPTAIIHGLCIRNDASSSEWYTYNTTVTYKCDYGYWFQSGVYELTTTCIEDGLWDLDVAHLICISVTCIKPQKISLGYVVYSGLSFSHKARYSCEVGYKIRSESVSICDASGEWSPVINSSSCQSVDCGTPPTIKNASITNTEVSTTYLSSVHYQCDSDHYFAAGINSITIKCNKDGQWTNIKDMCFPETDFECSFPPHVLHAYYYSNSSRTVYLQCEVGYVLDKLTHVELTQKFSCDDTGVWTPSPQPCQKVFCPDPLLQGSFALAHGVTQKTFEYGTVLDITCSDSLKVFKDIQKNGPNSWMTNINVTCGPLNKWIPALSSLKCEKVDCSTPVAVPNAEMDFNATTLNAVVTYECEDGMRFINDPKIETQNVICTKDGTWQPDANLFQCYSHKCAIPVPPEHSTFSVQTNQNLNETSLPVEQHLLLTCDVGYTPTGQYVWTDSPLAQKLVCTDLGEWDIDISTITCEVARCIGIPQISLIPLSISGSKLKPRINYQYGDIIVYTCPSGKWLSPNNVTRLVATCSWDGSWQPTVDALQCVDVTCATPPTLNNTIVTGDGVHVGAVWTYYCLYGYRMSSGMYSQKTSCQLNGQWLPSPPTLQCFVISCEIPPILPNIFNESLLAMKPGNEYFELQEGSKFTYSCQYGFWISNGTMKNTFKSVWCRNGVWVPPPAHAVRCVIVVCDTIYPVPGARSDGVNHVFKSNVTYTCARGQHFALRKNRRVNATCLADGRWWPNPHSLWCSDVLCEDPVIEGATKVMSGLGIDQTVTFSCPATKWFSYNQTQFATTCNENGFWDPPLKGMACQDIFCKTPPLENVLTPTNDFPYTTRFKLECKAGYYLTPDTTSPPEIVCDISGVWYPDPSAYTCKAVECVVPRYIRHATISGGNSFTDVAKVECSKGYFIRKGANTLEATCLSDSTWSEDLNSVFCVSFQCSSPKQIPNSVNKKLSQINPPNYNSVVMYQCNSGYWVDRQKYFQQVRCAEDGTWKPPFNFTCSEVSCLYPPIKRNTNLTLEGGSNMTEYPVGHVLRYICLNYTWLSAEHIVTEWAFTGLREVKIKCEVTGLFRPHPDSFACRNIHEGPLPVGYPRGLNHSLVKYQAWLEEENILTDDFLYHPYITAVPIETPKWMNGRTLKSSLAIGEVPSLPAHSASMAWDGDLLTSWMPEITKNRRYNLTIYLGRTYLMKGIEMYSGAANDQSDEVLDFRIDFSPNGKTFNFSLTASRQRGRFFSNNHYIFQRSGRITDSKLSLLNFNFVAKFIQITITATRDMSVPPSVREIRVLVAPVKWQIIYPPDYYTLPIFAAVIFLCFVASALFAFKQDKIDKRIIQFGWKVDDDHILSCTDCYLVSMKFSKVNQIKEVACRVIGSEANSDVMILDMSSNKRLMLMLPGSGGAPVRFDIGYTSYQNDDEEDEGEEKKIPTVIGLDVKVGHFCSDDPFYGRVPWICVRKSLALIRSRPIGVNLESSYQRSRRATVAKIAALDPIYWRLYHLLSDHLLYTVFFKDFITQTSRLDRLLITGFGYFLALALSAVSSKVSFFDPVYKKATCFGVGAMAALATLPIIICIFAFSLLFPVYQTTDDYDSGVEDTKKIHTGYWHRKGKHSRLSKRKMKSELRKSRRSTRRSKKQSSYDEADSGSDVDLDLDNMLQKFKRLDLRELLKKRSLSQRTFDSITDTFDSCLLPGKYRHYSLISTHKSDLSICSVDLKVANTLRRLRLPRRVRSAPAVMQFRGRTKFKIPRVSLSLDSYESDDRLSCASMWSNLSIVQKWHKVHTSVDQPISRLFSNCQRSEEKSACSWRDPTYLRIPSMYLKEGFRLPEEPIDDSSIREEARKRKKERNRLEKSRLSSLFDFNTTDVVELQSAATQFSIMSNNANRPGSSLQYPYKFSNVRKSKESKQLPLSQQYPAMSAPNLDRYVAKKVPGMKDSKSMPNVETYPVWLPDDQQMPQPSSRLDYDDDMLSIKDDDDTMLQSKTPIPLPPVLVERSVRKHRKATCPVPSLGTFFSSGYDKLSLTDGSPDGSNSQEFEESAKSIKQIPLKPFRTSNRQSDLKRKLSIIDVVAASDLYQGNFFRKMLYLLLFVMMLGFFVIFAWMGFRTLEFASTVACLYSSCTLTYFLITLSLEAVFREFVLRHRERISLSTLRHVHNSEEDIRTSRGLSRKLTRISRKSHTD